MELSVQMLRHVEGMPDARGDRPLFPKGWVGAIDPDTAIYLVAMDYAWGVGEWPEEILLSLEVVRAIVHLFRHQGIEPTQANVTAEIAARISLAEQHAADHVTTPAPDAAQVETTEPAQTSPKPRRKAATSAI